MFEKRIIDWNRERNGLKLDPELEVAMLTEEANEFFMSTNLVNMLREYADFMFVWTGTKAKYLSYYPDMRMNANCFLDNQEQFYAFEKWANKVMDSMGDLVEEELAAINLNTDKHTIIRKTLEAVVSANENKGTERDECGKIAKGPNYIAPDKAIAMILWEKGYDG